MDAAENAVLNQNSPRLLSAEADKIKIFLHAVCGKR
ncbi:hypothetical protein EVA_05024 [gut metagenome]|uniref:Uncharacterized protein n=1 Tax=gut metagenome TaxID=749906 RepID=J9D2L6_9ZZZZ